jgi:hypothetical protein
LVLCLSRANSLHPLLFGPRSLPLARDSARSTKTRATASTHKTGHHTPSTPGFSLQPHTRPFPEQTEASSPAASPRIRADTIFGSVQHHGGTTPDGRGTWVLLEYLHFLTSTALDRAILQTNPWPQLDGIDGRSWSLRASNLGLSPSVRLFIFPTSRRPPLGYPLDPRRLLI